jgi:hypothetical protein
MDAYNNGDKILKIVNIDDNNSVDNVNNIDIINDKDNDLLSKLYNNRINNLIKYMEDYDYNIQL